MKNHIRTTIIVNQLYCLCYCCDCRFHDVFYCSFSKNNIWKIKMCPLMSIFLQIFSEYSIIWRQTHGSKTRKRKAKRTHATITLSYIIHLTWILKKYIFWMIIRFKFIVTPSIKTHPLMYIVFFCLEISLCLIHNNTFMLTISFYFSCHMLSHLGFENFWE